MSSQQEEEEEEEEQGEQGEQPPLPLPPPPPPPIDSTNQSSHNAKSAEHRPMEFRFISGLDNTYSKPVRAHVLQRHLRERRLRAEKRGRSTGKAGDDSALASIRPTAELPMRSNAVKALAAPGRSHAAANQSGAPHSTSLGRHVGPKSLLGQGTIDPFLSTACQTTATENLLIDYYCGDILAPYGITRDVNSLHPPRDICMKMNMSDNACMHALFTYTAGLIHRRGGDAKYATISSQHRITTIQLIKERLKRERKSVGDTTLLAVIGLAASVCESRVYRTTPEQEQEMQVHVQGLRAMIAARGGISRQLYSPTVYWLLYWIDLCENGNAFPPSTSPSNDTSTIPKSEKPVSEDATWFAVDTGNGNLRENAAELVNAYGNFYHAAKARSMAALHATSEIVSSQSRAWLFHPVQHGTALHHLLCSAPGGILRSIVPTLYLNIVLSHYRHYYYSSPSNPDELAEFWCILRQARLAKSIVALIWILVTDKEPGSYRLRHPQSAWLLNRLLRVESRLSIHLQQKLKMTLVQFLLTDEVENLESSWLTPDEFRWVVMADMNFQS